MNIIEIIGAVASFLLGMLSFRASRSGVFSPVVLFWIGVVFMVISGTRVMTILGFINLAQSRAIIGIFYPFAVVAIWLDTRKKRV